MAHTHRETVETYNRNYTDFLNRVLYVENCEPGETIEVWINGELLMSHTMQYSGDPHVMIQVVDRGVKSPPPSDEEVFEAIRMIRRGGGGAPQ